MPKPSTEAGSSAQTSRSEPRAAWRVRTLGSSFGTAVSGAIYSNGLAPRLRSALAALDHALEHLARAALADEVPILAPA